MRFPPDLKSLLGEFRGRLRAETILGTQVSLTGNPLGEFRGEASHGSNK